MSGESSTSNPSMSSGTLSAVLSNQLTYNTYLDQKMADPAGTDEIYEEEEDDVIDEDASGEEDASGDEDAVISSADDEEEDDSEEEEGSTDTDSEGSDSSSSEEDEEAEEASENSPESDFGANDIEPPPDLHSIMDEPEPVQINTDIMESDSQNKIVPAGDGVSRKVKRKRKTKTKSGKPSKKAKRKSSNRRKNIRSILTEKELDAETLAAQNEELERKRRLQEIKKSLLMKAQGGKMEEKDSQLKSLLQAAEERASKAANDDVILLDSEDKKPDKKEKDVIELSSDDDCVMVPSDPEDDEIEDEDPNNGGAHINDELNQRDDRGRVLINIGHPPMDPDIYLDPNITKYIKPHQIGGVRFLYDNLVESLSRFKTSCGFGCILAHSMGLGKTIQMIGFIDIFLHYTDAKTALCIVPINTLQNWMAEFNVWLPENVEGESDDKTGSVPRFFKVYLLNDTCKTTESRAKIIADWFLTGGVLLMGYEMYRLLTSRKSFPFKPRKSKKFAGPEIIDVEEEDRNKSFMIDMHTALVNPGPDLVVCDEGHRIKNSHAGISQCLKNIRTRRRVVLTGYPLQNNLLEYWCMVDFVRPSFLGTRTEFSNMFERPIMNGQCADSTPQDVKLMRYRAYVLHSLLEGFVQRRGHTVLQSALPRKHEYVFLIKMSPVQRALYNRFMTTFRDSAMCAWANNNPLKAFAVCCKIWNHPDVLHKILNHKKTEGTDDNDLDIDPDTGSSKKKGRKSTQARRNAMESGFPGLQEKKVENMITYDWASELMKNYQPGVLENGGKMLLLYTLIEQSLLVGDKILVFSQSLFTLNLIEDFLSRLYVPRLEMNEKWARNKSYFRLDGSTSGLERERLIQQFNDPNNDRFWVFLLSTRAGCLGINLIGANRVVVVDASWNPCHDCQAVCRVYRFGQEKQSYVYRMVMDNTLEKKIYDRQVTKQGMSDRVVDELNPDNQFTQNQVGNLLQYEDKEFAEVDFSKCESTYSDSVVISVLQKHGNWLTKEPFTQESLLIDRKELRLTKKEKQLAKEGYARDKKMNVSYTRPSYAAFYPRGGPSQTPINSVGSYIHRRVGLSRPVASVKPMISTPVPMRLKLDGKPAPFGTFVRPGVTAHQVITTTDIVLPGNNTNTQAGMPRRIPAGQHVLVIKTLKGVYIRTSDGKLFAVRSKNAHADGNGHPGHQGRHPPQAVSVARSLPSGTLPGVSSSSTTVTSSQATGSFEGVTTTTTSQLPTSVSNTDESPSLMASEITPNPSVENLGTELLASIYSQTQAVNALLSAQRNTSNSPSLPESSHASSKDTEDDYSVLSDSNDEDSRSNQSGFSMQDSRSNQAGFSLQDSRSSQSGLPLKDSRSSQSGFTAQDSRLSFNQSGFPIPNSGSKKTSFPVQPMIGQQGSQPSSQSSPSQPEAEGDPTPNLSEEHEPRNFLSDVKDPWPRGTHFDLSSNYYNMASGTGRTSSMDNSQANQQYPIPPNPFLAAGLGQFPYSATNLPFLGQNSGLGFPANLSLGMQNPLPNSLPMMHGTHPGILGAALGQGIPSSMANQTTAASKTTTQNESNNSGQSLQAFAGCQNPLSLQLPFQQGLFGIPPGHLSYPAIQPMYMPLAMSSMMGQPMPFNSQGRNMTPLQQVSSSHINNQGKSEAPREMPCQENSSQGPSRDSDSQGHQQ